MNSTLLSPAAKAMLELNAADAYRKLVVHGDGYSSARDVLKTLTPAAAVAKPLVRTDEGQALLAGLWLWHDFLDESHTISQALNSKTGSLWHAILHRREGDFSNSKYWYHKAAGHPAIRAMAPKAAEIVRNAKNAQLLSAVLSGGWDPDAMVDLAEEAERANDPAMKETLIALQKAEWEAAFESSLNAAVAVTPTGRAGRESV